MTAEDVEKKMEQRNKSVFENVRGKQESHDSSDAGFKCQNNVYNRKFRFTFTIETKLVLLV